VTSLSVIRSIPQRLNRLVKTPIGPYAGMTLTRVFTGLVTLTGSTTAGPSSQTLTMIRAIPDTRAMIIQEAPTAKELWHFGSGTRMGQLTVEKIAGITRTSGPQSMNGMRMRTMGTAMIMAPKKNTRVSIAKVMWQGISEALVSFKALGTVDEIKRQSRQGSPIPDQ
jgi:hypothetical protein